MYNPERSAIENVSREEKSLAENNAERVINNASRPLVSERSMSKFGDIYRDNPAYNPHAIARDIAYVERRKSQFTESPRETVVPHAVEHMIRGWLDCGKIFDTEGRPNDDPNAVRSSDYDDFSHGADVVKTFSLAEDDARACRTRKLTTSFDVTIGRAEPTIDGKLTQFPNNLPYGFTSIKYYAEKTKEGKITISDKKTCVPRFTVGIDRDIAESLLRREMANNVENNLNEDTPNSVLTRFKILSEIYSETDLFLSKLPEEEKFDRQRKQLLTIKKFLEKPLFSCAEGMIPKAIESSGNWAPTYETKYESLPASERDSLKDSEPGLASVEAISKLIRNENSSCYDATYAAIFSGIDRFSRANPGKLSPKAKL